MVAETVAETVAFSQIIAESFCNCKQKLIIFRSGCIFILLLTRVSATMVALSKVSATKFRENATVKSQYLQGFEGCRLHYLYIIL